MEIRDFPESWVFAKHHKRNWKNFAAAFFVQVLDCINKIFFGGFVAMNMMADY